MRKTPETDKLFKEIVAYKYGEGDQSDRIWRLCRKLERRLWEHRPMRKVSSKRLGP